MPSYRTIKIFPDAIFVTCKIIFKSLADSRGTFVMIEERETNVFSLNSNCLLHCLLRTRVRGVSLAFHTLLGDLCASFNVPIYATSSIYSSVSWKRTLYYTVSSVSQRRVVVLNKSIAAPLATCD